MPVGDIESLIMFRYLRVEVLGLVTCQLSRSELGNNSGAICLRPSSARDENDKRIKKLIHTQDSFTVLFEFMQSCYQSCLGRQGRSAQAVQHNT